MPRSLRSAGHRGNIGSLLMRVASAFTIVLCSCCVSLLPREVLAQQTSRIGNVALLVDPKGPVDVSALRGAIGDSDPGVRMVAARIAGLLARKDLASPLLELLNREQDARVAREHVRALLYLRGVEVLPEARAASARLGVPVGSMLAEWLGRSQPEQFGRTMAELLADIPESQAGIFGRIAAMTIRQTPSARDDVTAALGAAASRGAWREFLEHLGTGADAHVLNQGLTSSDAAVREETIWFVVSGPRVGSGVRVKDLKAALSPGVAGPGLQDSEWAAFGRELIARRSGRSAAEDGSAAIRRHSLERRVDTRRLAAVPELTGAERSVLHDMFPDLSASPLVPVKQAKDSPPAQTKRVSLEARTFPSLGPGFLAGLLSSVECTPPSDGAAFGAAEMSYHRDGRPRAVALDTTTLQPPCARFLRVLAMLTVAQEDQPLLEGESEWLFISMNKADISCADEDIPGPGQPGGAERVDGGKVTQPRKTKDKKPVYPVSMQRARVVGAVIMEAAITASGCVGHARVVRGVQTPLDLAALQGVLGWRFEPTLLDGKPVPVIFTATMNFNLQ